jgi:hypothetical protein
MAAFVPHRSNKYFHVIASNGIVSSSPYIMTASPTASVRVFETIRDADVVTLRSVRSQRCRCEIARSSCRTIIDSGEASGPSSSGNTLPSSIHGRVARRSALPRERFSPRVIFGLRYYPERCPLYPDEQTSPSANVRSEKCQKPTSLISHDMNVFPTACCTRNRPSPSTLAERQLDHD